MLIIVTIKLIEPMIDEAPATCNEKIARSTLTLGMPVRSLRGG